jgi:hypothetical protein
MKKSEIMPDMETPSDTGARYTEGEDRTQLMCDKRFTVSA